MTTPQQVEKDHDILVEVRTKLDGVVEDIKRLSEGMHAQLSDHEIRLRTLETNSVTSSTYGPAHQALIDELETVKKYVWMGLGVVSILVIAINIGIRFIK